MVSTEANTNPSPDRGLVTQQARPTHAYRTSTCQNKSHHECSPGHGIADDGSAPCVGNTSMTPGVTSGAQPMHLNQPSIINPSNIQAELSLAASATQSETTTYYKTTQIRNAAQQQWLPTSRV